MADRSISETYLERLDGALPLTDTERAAAVEEIAAHLADATAELVERGLPADVAERRALSRLGAPERLAGDLAAAHRSSRDLLVAAGVALRWTVRTTVWSVLVTWMTVAVVGLALGMSWALISRLLSLPHVDWTPWISAPLAAITMALAAYAVGRSVVPPVAVAAHRPERDVRLALLAVGTPVTAWAGLAWISLEWNLGGALMAAALPAWFAIGLFKRNLVPAWYPLDRPRIGWGLIAVIVISLAGLNVTGGMPTTTVYGNGGRVLDPATEFAAIASFTEWETAPLEELPIDSGPMYGRGAGPVAWHHEWGVLAAADLGGWATLRAEVWATEVDPGIDAAPIADAVRVADAPLVVRGRTASADLDVTPVPDRDAYYVAVVGTAHDGSRTLLSWPSFRQWTWTGTPSEYFASLMRR